MHNSLSEHEITALSAVYERAKGIGLLGPGPVDAHIHHAEQFVEAAPQVPGRVLDLGSGGGVPGLVLALRWPRVRMTLLDAAERRTTFLQSAIEELNLGERVDVLRGRAEELGRVDDLRERFDLVVARSFAAPGVAAECGAPFLAVGGAMLVSEPPDDLLRWPEDGLAKLGLHKDQTEGPIAVLEKFEAIDERYPRRVGIPEKRPLF